MDYKDLTALLVKIGGVGLLVYGVLQIPSLVSLLHFGSETPFKNFFVFGVIPLIFPFLIGFWFLLMPSAVTNKLVKGDKLSASPPGFFFDLERVALSVLGVFLLFNALSDIAYHSAFILKGKELMIEGLFPGEKLRLERYAALVATVFELALALWLIFGAKGLLNILNRIRS